MSGTLSGSVRLVLPGVLREVAGGAGALEVPVAGEGATVRAVLDAATAGRPLLEARVRDERGVLRQHVNVFLDGEDIRRLAGLDTRVAAGAVVHLLPAVSGG